MTQTFDLKCPECEAPMILRETKKFLTKDGKPRKFYGCSRWPNCQGTHGAHPDGRPLGIPADKQTKEWRTWCHRVMEDNALINKHSLKAEYAKLAKAFGVGEIHIGEQDLQGCYNILRYYGEIYPSDLPEDLRWLVDANPK